MKKLLVSFFMNKNTFYPENCRLFFKSKTNDLMGNRITFEMLYAF